jgi:FMN reductase
LRVFVVLQLSNITGSTDMVKVLGIAGSLRAGSVSTAMVKQVLQASKEAGADIDIIDLKRYPKLPFCDGRRNNDSSYGTTVTRLRKKIKEADALVIGTPVFHGGYSGALKNLIDLNCITAFQGKPVTIVSAAGGDIATESALNQLDIVLRSLKTIRLPQQAAAGKNDSNGKGRITNEVLLQRLNRMGTELVTFTRKLAGNDTKAG